jgi:hypothetical protein
MTHHTRLSYAAAALLLHVSGAFPAVAQTITPDTYGRLMYRHIGLPGNRTAAVCGVPGDPMTYYVGAFNRMLQEKGVAGIIVPVVK